MRVLPNKIIKPIDSILCIGSKILSILIISNKLNIDQLYKELPSEISFEKYLLCLDFLFIIGTIEARNEIIKIRM